MLRRVSAVVVALGFVYSIALLRPAGAAGQLTEEAKLVASDGANWNYFGYAVALSGDTVLVGARKHDVDGRTEQGAAYVFVRTGGSWTQQAKLVAEEGAAGDEFGYSVALDGNTAVIGAPYHDIAGRLSQGAAFVFVRSGASWTQQGRLTSSDGAQGDCLGYSVAVSGNTALLGAPFAGVATQANRGAGYVFLRSGTTWAFQAKLTASDAAAGDVFGRAVSLDGDTALAGASGCDVAGVSDQGAAYVYVRNGVAWSEQAKLVAEDDTRMSQFGSAVAVDRDTAVAGSPFVANGGLGGSWVFQRRSGKWQQQAELVPGDGVVGDRFGYSVDVLADRLVVGAQGVAKWAGAAYVFARAGDGWHQESELMASDGTDGDDLGTSVAIGPDHVLAGAYAEIIGGETFVGAAYVFAACSFAVSPTQASVPTTGGAGSVGVTTGAACSWTATSDVPKMLAVIDGSSATGSGLATYSVAPNPGPARTGTLLVAGHTFTVTQANGCAYSLPATTGTVLASGGAGTAPVVASDATCPWTATSNVAWLTVTSGGPTAGSGAVAFRAEPNPGSARTGTLTVAGLTFTIDQAATASHLAYLAEGATGDFFDTRIAMLNPGDKPLTTTLRYLRPGGATAEQVVPIPPLMRATVLPETLLGPAEFSTVIESDGLLVVDRTMRWDDRGYGSHAECAVAAPQLKWYLAEGATHSGFELFYLVQNPNPEGAVLEVRYLRPAPLAVITRVYEVPANSRFNIWVNAEGPELANTDLSAVFTVTNGVPVIVERAMYLNTAQLAFSAGHGIAGVAAPATTWFLAEGATGSYFDLFVLVANPGDTEARVRARYLLPGGTVEEQDYTVAPNSRFNIWVDLEEIPAGSGRFPLADTAVSTSLTSTNGVPIIVERAMWWPWSYSTWTEAHASAGSTSTGTLWALAEGEVGGAGAAETYILIANTSDHAGRARVTLLFEDGSRQSLEFALAASSRTNVDPRAEFGVTEGRFGVLVEALGDPPPQIVVERAMYSDAGAEHWAAGTNALAMRLR